MLDLNFEDIEKDMEEIKYLKLENIERDYSFLRRYLTKELCEEFRFIPIY